MHIPDIKLAQLVERFEQIEARMGATTDSDEIVQLKGLCRVKACCRGRA